MHVARLKLGMAEYNTKMDLRNQANVQYMVLEMAHTGGKVIPNWSFLCHGFLISLVYFSISDKFAVTACHVNEK